MGDGGIVLANGEEEEISPPRRAGRSLTTKYTKNTKEEKEMRKEGQARRIACRFLSFLRVALGSLW
jgi:hypothetical protein